jgi:hypothetical protein
VDGSGYVEVQRKHARMSALLYGPEDAPIQLRLESVQGTHVLSGDQAMKTLVQLMPTVNRFGGQSLNVQGAVTLLEESGSPLRALTAIQRRHGARRGHEQWNRAWSFSKGRNQVEALPGVLHTMPAEYRLALEMTLHEESERRAMEGELAELERAWRDAEEIAHIADNMFVTPDLDTRINRLREHTSNAAANDR